MAAPSTIYGDHWSEVIWAAWQQAGVKVDKEVFREVYVYAEREPLPAPFISFRITISTTFWI